MFIGHIRGHSNIPGMLVEGNQMADIYTPELIQNIVEIAQQCYQLHHKNALTL